MAPTTAPAGKIGCKQAKFDQSLESFGRKQFGVSSANKDSLTRRHDTLSRPKIIAPRYKVGAPGFQLKNEGSPIFVTNFPT
jgi:hypothetical protein